MFPFLIVDVFNVDWLSVVSVFQVNFMSAQMLAASGETDVGGRSGLLSNFSLRTFLSSICL